MRILVIGSNLDLIKALQIHRIQQSIESVNAQRDLAESTQSVIKNFSNSHNEIHEPKILNKRSSNISWVPNRQNKILESLNKITNRRFLAQRKVTNKK